MVFVGKVKYVWFMILLTYLHIIETDLVVGVRQVIRQVPDWK